MPADSATVEGRAPAICLQLVWFRPTLVTPPNKPLERSGHVRGRARPRLQHGYGISAWNPSPATDLWRSLPSSFPLPKNEAVSRSDLLAGHTNGRFYLNESNRRLPSHGRVEECRKTNASLCELLFHAGARDVFIALADYDVEIGDAFRYVVIINAGCRFHRRGIMRRTRRQRAVSGHGALMSLPSPIHRLAGTPALQSRLITAVEKVSKLLDRHIM